MIYFCRVGDVNTTRRRPMPASEFTYIAFTQAGGKGFLNVAIVIKLLLRIVIYEIILECIQEKNHLQADDVANLLHRKVILKSI